MTGFQSIRIDILFTMWMKETSVTAFGYCLFARRVSESENAPTKQVSEIIKVRGSTYEGVLLGAQTIAILSFIII
jgi:hypothetical protein